MIYSWLVISKFSRPSQKASLHSDQLYMYLESKATAFVAINTFALGLVHPAQQPQRKQRLKHRVGYQQQKTKRNVNI